MKNSGKQDQLLVGNVLGRQCVTTPVQDGYIRVLHLRDRFRPATHTAAATRGLWGPVGACTIRRRLAAAGLRVRRPCIGPIWTYHHRQQRLQWAQHHWRRREWREVLFCDESRFHLHHADGRHGVDTSGRTLCSPDQAIGR